MLPHTVYLPYPQTQLPRTRDNANRLLHEPWRGDRGTRQLHFFATNHTVFLTAQAQVFHFIKVALSKAVKLNKRISCPVF